MVATFSPHRDGGGTLHFPSPTHIHHVDPSSALAQLRRSLSRSPSKGPTFRLITSKSASPSPSSPLSPSPLSPQKHAGSVSLLSNATVISPSPLATPFPPSAKKTRSGARRLSPPGTTLRSASLQRSPAKRGLSDSRDNGNATPPSPSECGIGMENRSQSASPDGRKLWDTNDGYFVCQASDDLLAPHHALGRREKGTGYLADYSVKSSPLKRSDGLMDLEQGDPGSPSAKRRSLHGASFSPDFDIFNHEAAVTAHAQPESHRPSEASFSDSPSLLDHANIFSAMPKRTSSLRKTTLQQRYEKPVFGRHRPNIDQAFGINTPGLPSSKGRPRMSLDTVLPPMPRESPFSSQGSLPSASVHPISHVRRDYQNLGTLPMPQRHPLSRTITQSSSSSSLAEDSPTHLPLRHAEPGRPNADFTKSLPVGGPRPLTANPTTGDSSTQTSSTEVSFATPENYKLAKPLPAAFMSTGLISKRNRDMGAGELDFNASLTSMPDTPCKRATIMGPTVHDTVPSGSGNKPKHSHHSVHSFGTPSTPFNPHVTRPSLEAFAKGTSIFGSSFGNAHLQRRCSFASVEGDDKSQSPSGCVESQSSTEFDVPPTPTKQVLGAPQSNHGILQEGSSHDLPDSENAEALEPSEHQSSYQDQCGKLSPNQTPCGSVDGDSDSVMEESPSTTLRFRSLNAISSYSKRSQFLGHSRSPAALSRKSFYSPFIRSRSMRTKTSPLSPASPLFGRIEPRSPQTPQGTMLPPDPSGLSISARGDGHVIQSFGNDLLFLPATPTASRDQVSLFGKGRASTTPVHGPAVAEVDSSLLSRFGKVEVIGTGEFSQVFRVTQRPELIASKGYFTLPPAQSTPQNPLPDYIWAVKKTRQAFIGPKDRQRKLQEVQVLKALGRSDHTIELLDNWETNEHLYIQTEYCEEGSLDLFLQNVGRKARLDDFRIWKIMLELSLVSYSP